MRPAVVEPGSGDWRLIPMSKTFFVLPLLVLAPLAGCSSVHATAKPADRPALVVPPPPPRIIEPGPDMPPEPVAELPPPPGAPATRSPRPPASRPSSEPKSEAKPGETKPA
jgi:hypothetical protein